MEVRIGQGGQTNYDISTIGNADNTRNNNVSADSSQSIVNNPDKDIVVDIKGIDIPENKTHDIKEEDIKKAVNKINKFIEDEKTHVVYEQHDKFKNSFIVKIVDDNTGQVIQEIPPKKLLDMVAKMCEMVGVIFDKKA
ncbi:MAG: flagellar protein FlaG [Bacillota bacterium]|nr:flagellar protein FlaG [Bacillota bacterium]